jgi:hypothetical protein
MITNIGYGFGATHTQEKSIEFEIDAITTEDLKKLTKFQSIPPCDQRADSYLCNDRKVVKILKSKLQIKSRLKSLGM